METIRDTRSDRLVDVSQINLQYPADDTIDRTDPLAWLQSGLCGQTNPESFFPEKGDAVLDAKLVCTVCEVGAKCLQYALENKQDLGVWGGYAGRERKNLPYYGKDVDIETAQRLYEEQRSKTLKRAFELDSKRVLRSQKNTQNPSAT